MQWELSPRAAAGPLLRQPAHVLVMIMLGAAMADPTMDASKLRDLLVDPARTSERRLVVSTSPAAPTTPPSNAVQRPVRPVRKPNAIVPVREAARSGVDPLAGLPESLRKLAADMGGVPAWFVGPSVQGEIKIPGEDY